MNNFPPPPSLNEDSPLKKLDNIYALIKNLRDKESNPFLLKKVVWQKYKEMEMASSLYFSQNHEDREQYRQTLLHSLPILTNINNLLLHVLGNDPYLYMAFKSLQTSYRIQLIRYYIDSSYDHREISAFVLAEVLTDESDEAKVPPLPGLYNPDFRLYFYSTLNNLTSMGDMYSLLIQVLTVVEGSQLVEWADKAFQYYYLAMTFAEGVSFLSIYPLYKQENKFDMFYFNLKKHFHPIISIAKLIIDLYSLLQSKELELSNAIVQGSLTFEVVKEFVAKAINKIDLGLKELCTASEKGMIKKFQQNKNVVELQLIKKSFELSLVRFNSIRKWLDSSSPETLEPLFQFIIEKHIKHLDIYVQSFGGIEGIAQSQVSNLFINDLAELVSLHAVFSNVSGRVEVFEFFLNDYITLLNTDNLKKFPNLFFVWILSSLFVYTQFKAERRLRIFLDLIEQHVEHYRNKSLDYISLVVIHHILVQVLEVQNRKNLLEMLDNDEEYWYVYKHLHDQFVSYIKYLSDEHLTQPPFIVQERLEERLETDFKSFLIPQFSLGAGGVLHEMYYVPFNRRKDILSSADVTPNKVG